MRVDCSLSVCLSFLLTPLSLLAVRFLRFAVDHRFRGQHLEPMLKATSAAEDDPPAFVEWNQAAVNRARPLRREAAPIVVS